MGHACATAIVACPCAFRGVRPTVGWGGGGLLNRSYYATRRRSEIRSTSTRSTSPWGRQMRARLLRGGCATRRSTSAPRWTLAPLPRLPHPRPSAPILLLVACMIVHGSHRGHRHPGSNRPLPLLADLADTGAPVHYSLVTEDRNQPRRIDLAESKAGSSLMVLREAPAVQARGRLPSGIIHGESFECPPAYLVGPVGLIRAK